MTEQELRAMTVKDLRRYVIDNGLGITYAKERTKDELIRAILEVLRNHHGVNHG